MTNRAATDDARQTVTSWTPRAIRIGDRPGN